MNNTIKGNVSGHNTETKQIRTVQKLYLMIKERDPETMVSANMVRRIVYNGEIPSVKSGNKRLACFEDLAAYLFDGKRWH